MPFTGSARDYVGGQLIAGGISQAGGALADALKQYEEDKARAAWGDVTFDYLAKNVPGAVSPEVLQRYHGSSAKERAQMAIGAQWNAANILSQQNQAWQNRLAAAHANYYLRGGEDQPFNLTPEEAAEYAKAGKIPLRTSRRSFQVAEGPEEIDLDTAGNPVYSQDKSMYRSGGKWKPVTEAMRKSIEDYEAKAQAQQEAAKQQQAQQGPNWWQRLWGPPSPTPTPPVAPAPAFQQPPATREAPGARAPARTRAGAETQTAAQIKAAYRNGQLTREEAISQLNKIGFQ